MNEQSNNTDDKSLQWERSLIEKLALASVTEQRRSRRWGIFFKSLLFVYLIGFGLATFYPDVQQLGDGTMHTAVIDVIGIIAEGEPASAKRVIKGLQNALADDNTKGIILNINSPGGSPVQAAYIYQEIKRARKLHPKIPIHAVVSDICASGGYYVAAAADNIYVSRASIIGSIGVIMDGFGFVGAMRKLGIDRRLIISGKDKALLDPFSPTNKAHAAHMQSLADAVHRQFIEAVHQGRGQRLQDNEDIFSGLVWTGEQGVALGLADDFGSVDLVAKNIIGASKTLSFTPKENVLDRITDKFAATAGRSLGNSVTGFSLR